jgi:GTP-binding protein HflX
MIQKLRISYPRSIQVSAKTGEGLDVLLEEMMNVIKDRRKRVTLKIPQSEYHVVAEAIREGTIFSQTYEENDIVVDVELPQIHAQQLAHYMPTTDEH